MAVAGQQANDSNHPSAAALDDPARSRDYAGAGGFVAAEALALP